MVLLVALAAPAAPFRGPASALVPPEVESCRARGALWLSDPDGYERTEIVVEGAWTPVWQVLDRYGGREGWLLIYPGTCRVVVRIVTPSPAGPPEVQLVPPPGGPVTEEETRMFERWAAARVR